MPAGEHIRIAPLLAEAWHRAQPGQIVGPRHARPQAGAARGSGPAASGEFDHACARCRRNVRSGRRNRCLDRTREHGSACRIGHALDTVTCPTGGETENASHTEILTIPWRRVDSAAHAQTEAKGPAIANEPQSHWRSTRIRCHEARLGPAWVDNPDGERARIAPIGRRKRAPHGELNAMDR
jgi:hypothetical protein